jgi:hypothetical protein
MSYLGKSGLERWARIVCFRHRQPTLKSQSRMAQVAQWTPSLTLGWFKSR